MGDHWVRNRRLCKHCLLSHLLFPPLLLQTPFAPESKILNLPACFGGAFVADALLRCCIQSAERRADWHGPDHWLPPLIMLATRPPRRTV